MRPPSAIVSPTLSQERLKSLIYGIHQYTTMHGMRQFSAVRFLQASTNMIVLWLSVRILVTFRHGASVQLHESANGSRNIETHVILIASPKIGFANANMWRRALAVSF